MMVIHLLHRHGWFLYMDIQVVSQKDAIGSLSFGGNVIPQRIGHALAAFV